MSQEIDIPVGGPTVEEAVDEAAREEAATAAAVRELATRAREYFDTLGRAPNPRERFWFVFDAWKDGLIQRGLTSPVMAEAWDMALSTVERSVCDVKNAMLDPSGVERNREEILWLSRRRSEELYERAMGATDRDAAALAAAAGREVDRWAAASGAVQPASFKLDLGNVVAALKSDDKIANETRAALAHDVRDGYLGALDRVLALLGATDAQRELAHERFRPNAQELWKARVAFDEVGSWRDAKQWAQEQTRRLPEGSGER
jgi:hypothetical protein